MFLSHIDVSLFSFLSLSESNEKVFLSKDLKKRILEDIHGSFCKKEAEF